MIENNLKEKVIGVILDGTGLGYDDKIWGGEIFVGDYTCVERVRHLEYMPLPGGDSAIREPWKILVSYLYCTLGNSNFNLVNIEKNDISNICEIIEKNLNIFYTSSMGRLFDAVSVFLEGPKKIRYEAEAAIYLEEIADKNNNDYYEFQTNKQSNIISVKNIMLAIYNDLMKGVSNSEISAKFHNTIINTISENLINLREQTKINNVVLSGGVFQNEFVTVKLENKLHDNDFQVFVQSKIPANDGGISLGQASIVQQLILNKMREPNYILNEEI
jgi:hydrogenase maturation protein HypF